MSPMTPSENDSQGFEQRAGGAAAIPAPVFALAPTPPSERRSWLLACALGLLGVAVLVAVLSGAIGQTSAVAPPPVLLTTATPAPASTGVLASAPAVAPARILARPSAAAQGAEARSLLGPTEVHIARRWMEGFYPIYATAQSTFGVSWLLIASIHMQESAFSTAPSTYRGLNFAHCCGGPMQFNVTNGGGRAIPSTWDLVADSYIYGHRPASYDHMTATHPSIYDDFDAIMAAAHLLSADGAGYKLDGAAWDAAYDYYGHDATGVAYADQVLARAIGWSQHGFCINCGVQPKLIEAVHAAYGAPALAALESSSQAATACASNSPATRSVAPPVPPSRRRESCARLK
jgi:hypothetical protein